MQATELTTIEASITFLNMTGDITIAWDDTNREQMLALVQEKMAQGYSFFILQPRFLGASREHRPGPQGRGCCCRGRRGAVHAEEG